MDQFKRVLPRLSGMAISLLGLSVLVFTISRVLPGNPARMALGARASDEQVAKLASEMGLNKPLTAQYLDYITGLFVGDLGLSLQTRNPVIEDILFKLPATLELITLALVFMVAIGIPLGVVAAQNRGGLLDNVTRVFAFSAVSVPSFFIAIVLQVIFGFYLDLFPITGRLSLEYSQAITRETGFMLIDTLLAGSIAAHANAWAHLILPALALSFGGMGQIIRITRSSMVDVEGKDFIEASRGYGLPGWLVVYKYSLKNAFIPTLTIIGLLYAWLLGGAFIIEIVFGWPGLAKYGVQSVLTTDVNALVGVTMTIGLMFVLTNFVVDLILDKIDPRIQLASDAT